MKRLLTAVVIACICIAGESCRTYVDTQPTATIAVRPAQPAPNYVWVDGYWRPRNRTYVYTDGYWVQPRGRRHTYVAGAWVQTSNGYYYRRGYWR